MITATPNANIARHLALMEERQPDRTALKIPRGRTPRGEIDYLALTFRELAEEVAAWREQLQKRGVHRGDRTLVMVKPGLPLIASAFALFQLGAVPVIIDPGMGLKNFLACVARTRPRVLLGIPAAQWASRIFRGTFKPVEVRVRVSGSLTARLTRGDRLRSKSTSPEVEIATSAATDLAAILFTSGSTGAPKGVCYEHGMFEAQVRLIRETYAIEEGEIDLPMLPIFALFNPALGMTTIVPEIDARRPAQVDPAKIVQAIRQEKVTSSFGSPTLWKKIGDHCLDQKITLPTLRRVLCAGAPVPSALWTQSSQWLSRGLLQSPYGATEALPISSVSAQEVDVTSVHGACVGRPLAGIQFKIIALTDEPIATLALARELAAGEIGEIIVNGPVVTNRYDALPVAEAAAKISSDRGVWHRMGDCGYFDAEGRLWFCGRKVERVETPTETYYTEPCEQVFRQHPKVTRCALVKITGIPLSYPAMVIEGSPSDELVQELGAYARRHAHTAAIDTFYFHPAFPVDVRHNAKIHRLTLAKLVAGTPAYHTAPRP